MLRFLHLLGRGTDGHSPRQDGNAGPLAREDRFAGVDADGPGFRMFFADEEQALGLVARHGLRVRGPDFAGWRRYAHDNDVIFVDAPKAGPKQDLGRLAGKRLCFFPVEKNGVDVGLLGAESGIEAAGSNIGHVVQGLVGPQRILLRGGATALHGVAGERRHMVAIDLDLKMQVGKFRVSGQANQSQFLA